MYQEIQSVKVEALVSKKKKKKKKKGSMQRKKGYTAKIKNHGLHVVYETNGSGADFNEYLFLN